MKSPTTPMTVGELRGLLSRYPEDMVVVGRVYEDELLARIAEQGDARDRAVLHLRTALELGYDMTSERRIRLGLRASIYAALVALGAETETTGGDNGD